MDGGREEPLHRPQEPGIMGRFKGCSGNHE